MKNFRKWNITFKKFGSKLIIALLGLGLIFISTGYINKYHGSSNELTMLMQGVIYTIEVTDHEQYPPKTESMEIAVKGNSLKMGIAAGKQGNGKGSMIFRGDRGTKGEVIVVDDDKREYFVIDENFAKDIKGSIDESMNMANKMMEDVMKNLTKEQIEAIEKITSGTSYDNPGLPTQMKPKSKPEKRKTSERATKLGYPCVKYEVTLDGRILREIWTTDWYNVEGGNEAQNTFNLLYVFFDEMADPFGGMSGGENPYEELNFENGFPVVIEEFDEFGELEEETFLRSAKRQTIDPDAFEPPSGYRLRTMGPGY